MNRSILALSVVFLATSALTGQTQQQPKQETAASSTIRSTTQEVVLDMVFRDKKGRTMRDIRPEEIHISEDGVEQTLKSFQLVEGRTSATGALPESTQVGPKALDPVKELRLVTLVFEGLDLEGKRFFRGAVKDILNSSPEQNLYFSILTIDQKLQCIQPFTSDHDALMKSLDKSAMWSFIQYSTQSADVKANLRRIVSSDEPTISGGARSGPSQSQIQDAVSYRMAKMQYDMLQAADSADREYNTRATLDALLAIVHAQAELPGRKVVLYFNPNLYISETVKEQYQDLISSANRANVSFYTVDPKGLVTWSQGTGGRESLADATKEIRDKQMRGGVGEVSTQEALASENAESALRSNPLLWLRDLAQQTGGATIAETNDYRAPLKLAMEEVRTYYEATYVPHIEVYDGRFRRISVRVDRPDTFVHTRSGYFALPHLKDGQQLYAYEMPLLNALNAAASPSDVAFRAAAERFNDRGPKIEYMVTIEAPLKGLAFTKQPDQKTAAVDAALLAVIKDTNGEIVDKFSKDFAVQVSAEKVDAYKGGNLVQTFRTALPAGEYTLAAVVMDRNAQRIGVEKTPLKVPEPSSKLSMSDVVVVRRTDPLKDSQMLDAFYFPGGKVVPTLAETLKGGPGNVLPFYFAVYPDPAIKDSLKLTMAFYKDGQYLGAAEAPLPAIQPDGRIPYIANLPADKFTPGAYQIRIGIVQGASKVEQDVVFKVD